MATASSYLSPASEGAMKSRILDGQKPWPRVDHAQASRQPTRGEVLAVAVACLGLALAIFVMWT